MSKPINYKQRNILLWCGTAFILLLSYVMAFNQTIHLVSENNVLQTKLDQAANAPDLVRRLEQESLYLQKKMRFLTEHDDLRQEVLELLGEADPTRSIILKSMKSPAVFRDNQMHIETYEVTLQGDFIPLIKTIYYLEQQMALGKVAGVKVQVEKDKNMRNDILVAYVYIQTSRKYDSIEAI